MKKSILIGLFFLFYINSFSKDFDTDSTKNKLRKNTVRLELLGKSTLVGIVYDRLLFHKKVDGYISVGTGMGFTFRIYPYPNMFNASFYVTADRWKVNPVLGFGSFALIEYNPYPADKSERDYLISIGGGGGPAPAPPFTFNGYLMAGANIKFTERWNCQILCTPLLAITYSRYFGQQTGGVTHFGGINFGYKF